MKQAIGKIFQKFQKSFLNHGSEYEQALIRIFLTLAVFAYLSYKIFFSEDFQGLEPAYWASIIYLCISLAFAFFIYRNNHPSSARQFWSMFVDVCIVTFAISSSGESGSVFYGIYLWLAVGNGLRYGSKSLLIAQGLSLIGFTMVLLTNHYWASHLTLWIGLLLTLIAIPLFTFSLLTRLQQAIVHAQEANKAKSFFLAKISHEIRTPLNGIIGASELIMNSPLSPDQQELANTMKNSGHVLLKLIESVLDFAKIESGKLTLETTDFDLHQLVSNSASIFALQAERKGLRLLTRVSPETEYLLRGDAQKLRQIIINLLGNAIKFTHQGKVELRVSTLEQNETKARLHFEIIDTGIGIPEDAQHAIFESFKQVHTDMSNNYGGTGLGTTISKQLVEFMGGKIGLCSSIVNGTTFWFELPFEKSQMTHTLESTQTLQHARILGTGISQREQAHIAACLSSWGVRFDHADSIDQLHLFLERNTQGRQQNHVILCNPKGLDLSPQDFISGILNMHEPGKMSIIMLDDGSEKLSENDLVILGYDCLLSIPVNKTLLFNTLHRVLSADAGFNDVISFIKHYERTSTEKRQLQILVADDNATNRMIISRILERAGHSVDLMENGEQALDFLEDKRYDLAIMDMHMPVMDGIEAMKIFRVTERTSPPIPFVILTANATVEAKRECEEAGADAYLTKPIDAYSLLETIAKLTGKHGKTVDLPRLTESKIAANGNALLLNENTLHHLELLDGESGDFLQDVIQGYLLNGEQLIAAMRKAVMNQDHKTFRELAHALQGSSGNVGADALFAACKELALFKRSEMQTSAGLLLNAIQECFDATRLAMIRKLEASKQSSLINRK